MGVRNVQVRLEEDTYQGMLALVERHGFGSQQQFLQYLISREVEKEGVEKGSELDPTHPSTWNPEELELGQALIELLRLPAKERASNTLNGLAINGIVAAKNALRKKKRLESD
jgi:hypothetical protein